MASSSSSSSSSNFGELVLVLGDLHIPQRAAAIPEKFKRMLVPHKMQHVICTGNVGTSVEVWKELQQLSPNFHAVAGDFDDCHFTNSGESGVDNDSTVIRVGNFTIGVMHAHQIIPSPFHNDNNNDNNNTNNDNHHNIALDLARRKLSLLNTTSNSYDNDDNDSGGVDIFITGHSHVAKIEQCGGVWKNNDDTTATGTTGTNAAGSYYHINPGSITGAFSSSLSSSTNKNNNKIVPSFVLLAVQQDKIVCYLYKLLENPDHPGEQEVDVSKTEIIKPRAGSGGTSSPNNNNAKKSAALESLLR